MTDTILKALVGSRAHGLNRPDSDWDWRGVYVQPTEEILSLGYTAKSVQWLEGKEDFTNYEVGHFLMLATKANPSVLELLVSPHTDFFVFHGRNWGEELRELLPYLFEPQDAFNAFCGYSLNQRKKLLDDKDGRKWKYALAYIRTLYCLIDLLETGTFSLQIKGEKRLYSLTRIRDKEMSVGDVINLADHLVFSARIALENSNSCKDMAKINAWLLEVRKAFWVKS